MAVFTPEFNSSPWILALFPPVLTVRGGIGGIFSGNLATMLHLGIIKPQLRDNTQSYYGLVKSVLVITVMDTMILGTVSFIINLLYGTVSFQHILVFLSIPTVSCIFAVLISIPLSSYIAIETFNRGLDPDILVYPILASLNDIIVTIFFVGAVSIVLFGGIINTLFSILFFLILIGGVYLVIDSWSEKFFQQTLREGVFIVVISSLFGSMNGILLSNLSQNLSKYPGLMVMYPALTNSLGNIGSILGSKATTDIALGVTKNIFKDVRGIIRGILEVEVSAAFMHIIFASTSYIITRSMIPGISLKFILIVAICTNLLGFIIVSGFALYSANLAFQNGLNPDNVVIPAITTFSDTIATLSMTPAIMIARFLI
jgi:mgtE-like transporter